MNTSRRRERGNAEPSDGSPPGASADGGATGARPYVFRLYVSGATPASARAVVNARRIFETHLPGRYRLEILDIGDHVREATDDQVVATPTLVRLAPLPLRRFIGNLSNVERLLSSLPPAPSPQG
jgi:circadian clock protein KaiB